MLDKETFKKEYIRMMDSIRTTDLGSFDCKGVYNCNDCPLNSIDCDYARNAFDIIEIVEKWSKEHPIVTNADKFKEVFGIDPRTPEGTYICPAFTVTLDECARRECDNCRKKYWESEYKEPEKK